MQKLQFAAGITLYNPQFSTIEHINEYLNSFDAVLVFDNSDKRGTEHDQLISMFSKDSRLIYIDAKENKGLPYAYNCLMADNRIIDYDYMCTLDQDSIFKHEDIEMIKSYIEKHQQKLKNRVAEIGPYVDYGRKKDNEHSVEKRIEEKPWVITSGAFINLYLLRKLGFKYDEKYFIDKFEIDLCKQFTNAGYKIIMYHNAVLHQRLGEDSGHDHPNHSALRHYYLFRNRFYFNHKFYSLPKRWVLNILQTGRHVLLIAIYETAPIKKISMLWDASHDWMVGRFGKK